MKSNDRYYKSRDIKPNRTSVDENEMAHLKAQSSSSSLSAGDNHAFANDNTTKALIKPNKSYYYIFIDIDNHYYIYIYIYIQQRRITLWIITQTKTSSIAIRQSRYKSK